MTENSMFFSDGSWYTQNMFARFISDIFGEGVVADIDDELEVSANSPANMAVQVKTGRSYVKGYIHEILTDPVQLTISDADPTNPRIDRIVLRLDVSTNRRIRVAVLEGTAAASPVAPTLTQTSSVWEISLAQVYVSANATVINSANITDERTYMTMQRANMPLASTTAVGSVKIGDGIEVSNGVISMGSVTANTLKVANVDTTNSSGFAVGSYAGTIANAFSASATTPYSSSVSYTNVGSQYQPMTTRPTITSYPPFQITATSYKVAFTANCTYTASGALTANFRALRVKDSSVLATSTGGSMTVTLPADWDYSTDRIQFQGDGSRTGIGTVSVTITVSTGSVSGTLYYKPTAGS